LVASVPHRLHRVTTGRGNMTLSRPLLIPTRKI
jgi:hypothetical protein